MSDEKALLAAIWAAPHEDTPRLVYADWLQETGEPAQVARAEFIRLQCERARLDEWDDAARIEQIKTREAELWKAHAKVWKAGLPRELKSEPFRRGFVYSRGRSFGGAAFLRFSAGAFDAAPQWNLTLRSFARLFDRVFRSPLLVRVDELSIDMNKCPHDALAELADNDRLRNVSALSVGNQRVGNAAGATAFFNGPAPAAVTKLSLWTATPEVFAALAASRTAARLRDLFVCFDGAGTDALPPVSSQTFPQLRSLQLRPIESANATDALARFIVANPDPPFRQLSLRYAGLSDAGAELLAAWPGLARVRWLDLDSNRFGAAGFLALARSPFAGNLKYLNVHGYWLERLPDVKAELDARFGPAIHYG